VLFAADFAAFRLHLIRKALSEGKFIAEELALEGVAAIQEAAKDGNVDEIYWATSKFCMGRQLFSAREDMLGLGPWALREEDLCCVFFGAPVP
jgi:hypothetical protein